MATEAVTGAGQQQRVDAALIRLGVAVLLGVIVSVMDGTLMVVAIDAISREFAASASTTQWITSAYLLANCAAIPASGHLVDRFSARTVWLTSLVAFLVSSLLCGVAWSALSLVSFRVLQGLAGGLVGMAAMIVITRAAGPERAGRAFSLIGVPTALAPALGPILGGAVVDAVGWRWLFYGQVPLLVVALAAAWHLLPQDPRDRQARMDWIGLLLLAPGLSALVYGLSEISHAEGARPLDVVSDPTAGGVAAVGALLTVVFVWHALRRRDTAIIDLRLFGNRTFSIGSSLLFVVGFVLYGLLFLVPLYYQQVVGLSATAAGALLAPQGAGMGFAAIFVGSLNDRFGPRPVVLGGLTLTIVGTIAFTQADPEPDGMLMAISLGLRGIGLAMTSIPLSAALYQSGLSKEAYPHIATSSTVVMRLGGAVGAAAAAVILLLASDNAARTGAVSAEGFATAFWWMTGLLLAPLVIALFLPGRTRAVPEPSGLDVDD